MIQQRIVTTATDEQRPVLQEMVNAFAMAEKCIIDMDTRITKTKGGGKRSILESKAIAGIKTLGSDKVNFRAWHEKFVNVMAQTIKGAREGIYEIVKAAN